MRKQVTMRIELNEKVTISFHKDNSYTVAHSNINRGTYTREFDNFIDAREHFWQTIGALYLDGYR